jgi:hypothetical protein
MFLFLKDVSKQNVSYLYQSRRGRVLTTRYQSLVQKIDRRVGRAVTSWLTRTKLSNCSDDHSLAVGSDKGKYLATSILIIVALGITIAASLQLLTCAFI